ncbi:MAG: hypothetical protein CM1200mP2_21140 [Planctomycetaceae bacterium]|nr:MAG: hypothetical protein CM1200mP2_21140 [Planctomycetaceae bacterium]
MAVSLPAREIAGRAPEGRVLLRTFVGGELQPGNGRPGDSEIERGEEELGACWACGGSRDGRRGSLPGDDAAVRVGHLTAFRRSTAGAEIPGLALAGNAFRGVGLPDCIASGVEAAKRCCRRSSGVRVWARGRGRVAAVEAEAVARPSMLYPPSRTLTSRPPAWRLAISTRRRSSGEVVVGESEMAQGSPIRESKPAETSTNSGRNLSATVRSSSA